MEKGTGAEPLMGPYPVILFTVPVCKTESRPSSMPKCVNPVNCPVYLRERRTAHLSTLYITIRAAGFNKDSIC